MSIRRSLFWTKPVTADSMHGVLKDLMELIKEDGTVEISLYISSSDGSFDQAMTFCSFVQVAGFNFNTYATGSLDSSSLPIFLLGKQRFGFPQTSIILNDDATIFDRRSALSGYASDKNLREEGGLRRKCFAALVTEATGGQWTEDEILLKMKKQTLILLEEAAQVGLITEII